MSYYQAHAAHDTSRTAKTPPRDFLQGEQQQQQYSRLDSVDAAFRRIKAVEADAEVEADAASVSDTTAASSFVVSEIINPDGSVTQRRLVLNADGSDSVVDVEEQQQQRQRQQLTNLSGGSSLARPPRPTLKTSNTTTATAARVDNTGSKEVKGRSNGKASSSASSGSSSSASSSAPSAALRPPGLVAANSWESSTQSSGTTSNNSQRQHYQPADHRQTATAAAAATTRSSSPSNGRHLVAVEEGRRRGNSVDDNAGAAVTSGVVDDMGRRSRSVSHERSERNAHELRRQRLARARKVPPALDREVDEPLYSPSRFDALNSIDDFENDDGIFDVKVVKTKTKTKAKSLNMGMQDNKTANAGYVLSSPPRPKRTTAGKHVAFLEPATHMSQSTADRTEDLTNSFGSSNTSGHSGGGGVGGDGSSMAYPLLDISGSTNASGDFARNVDADAIVTSFEGSSFFNSQSMFSSDESTGLFTDIDDKRSLKGRSARDDEKVSSPENFMSSSPGNIERMTRKANQNFNYDQYIIHSLDRDANVVGDSGPNTTLDEILGPLPDNNLLPPMTASVASEKSPSVSGSQGSRSRISRQNGVIVHKIETDPEKERANMGQKEAHELHTATVYKATPGDKVGIVVGIQQLEGGDRLVVSRVSSTGKFADSGIEPGDTIVSINGRNFLNNPSSQIASEIVKNATGLVRIVYRKGVEHGDIHSVSNTTVSSITYKDYNAAPMPALPVNDEGSAKAGLHNINESPSSREKMCADGSLSITKDSETDEPYPVLTSESWKLSGAIVIGIKKSTASQDAGLRMSVKETAIGRALVVSHITPSSPFASTPLRPGDIILSINSISLRENADVVDAYSALGKSGREVTMVAKKAEHSLREFLTERRGTGELTAPSAHNSKKSSEFIPRRFVEPSPFKKKFAEEEREEKARSISEFDEESYGSALFGYNPSKSVFINKSDPTDEIGMELICLNTEWGKLLTVSRIVPGSLAANTDIDVGDAILSINGVNFREHPNAPRASLIMKDARQKVFVEYQKLNSFDPAVPVTSLPPKESSSTVRPSNESQDLGEGAQPDYENEKLTIVSLSDDDSPNFFDARSKSDSTGSTHKHEIVGKNTETEDSRAKTINVPIRKEKQKMKRIWVTVRKEKVKQQIGISLSTVNNSLVVASVSPTGSLRSAPVSPGDTIMTINKRNFRDYPDEKLANEIIRNSMVVTMEILKTGQRIVPAAIEMDENDSMGETKYCLGLGGNIFRRRQQRSVQQERTFSMKRYNSTANHSTNSF